jgi:hypothetical protein
MGIALEIDCARHDARGRVSHVGGPGVDGRRWMEELVVVIAAAESGRVRYYVSHGAQQLGLQVRDGQLATMVDDGWTVLRLPVCAK